MKKILSGLSILILLGGCASKYKHNMTQTFNSKLNNTKGVLISVPKNGIYGNTTYQNSGVMTASAIRSAFSKHTSTVDLNTNCSGKKCLKSINSNKYAYYVIPTIYHWEDRATEWSGKLDRVEIGIKIYDTRTLKIVSNSSYTGQSKWATFGGDHPQDLLPVPTNEFVNKLYR